jgi:NAD(P)-dependent dehydrogenase (short-subunit alcohol dehydrogenase family)
MHASKMFDLTGKVALVTGGSRGIGLSIAEGLGEMGAKVMICARKQHEIDAALEHLRARDIDAHAHACDIAKADSIAPLVDATLGAFGTIDILVNNAGTNWSAPAEEYPDKGWHKVMDVCITAPFMLTREVGRRVMLPKRGGAIINIGSTAGSMGNGSARPGGDHFIGYHSAKGALVMFTKALAVEWGDRNIRVNCISPGFIDTDAARDFQTSVQQYAMPATPLRRYGSGIDIKGVAAFLASEAAAFMTGQDIFVDGGLSAN